MGLVHATAMVVGIIVGASIFVQPSEITRLAPTTSGAMLAWLAAGGLTLCGALVCAELASVFTRTGGVYVFLKEIFSPSLGFLWGWGMFWSVHSGIIAALSVILARYLGYFVHLSDTGIRAVAIFAILGLSAIHYLSIRPGTALQVALTAVKLVAIAILVAVLFSYGGPAHRALPAGGENLSPSVAAWALAVGAGLFSFGGWHMVTYTAGETREPARTIPRALLAGTLIVTASYMLLNAAYLYVLPLADVARSTRVAADAVERALGAHAGAALAVLVVVSALGSLNGIVLAGPRVYYAMAEDGLAFRWLGRVHRERQTPHLAIAAQAVWSSVLVATNTYRELFTRVVYTEWLFFALLAVGLFLLRRKPDYRPPVQAWGFPVIPLLFIAGSMTVVVNQLRADPRSSAVGLGLLLLGLPVYFVWSHRVPQ